MVDISLIIACYNEESLLRESVRETVAMFEQTRYTYELIFIDDCSEDATVDIIKELCDGRENYRYIIHDTNQGRGQTVKDGIIAARGSYVGFIDIDLEVHCRYVPSMLMALDNGYDVAIAYRVYKLQFGFNFLLRHILSLGYRALMQKLTGIKCNDTETGYKFFNRNKVLPLAEKSQFKGWFWDTEIMYLCETAGLQCIEIPALFIRRGDKVSKLNVIPDTLKYFSDIYRFRKIYL